MNKLLLATVGVVLGTIAAINAAVAYFGGSAVFVLSPFFLREKTSALGHYVLHRVGCSHPDPAPLIAAAERKHKIPRRLLASLLLVESEGRPHRISPAGAMGIAQFVPVTAARFELADPFDTAAAIDASARFLAAELRRTKSPRLAVAAYNAGPGNVHHAVPENGETEHHVAKVMRAWRATLRAAR